MKKVIAFFKLVRWRNLLMIALMMLLVYHCLMSPLKASCVIGALPPSPSFSLLLISLIFIVAAGYVINDFFDVEIDKINKPERLIVSNVFSETEVKLFYGILMFLGLVLGLVSGIMALGLKFYVLPAILILLSVLLYYYSFSYKKRFIIGNVIVSLSVAFSVMLPWIFEMLYLSENILILSSLRDVIMSSSMSQYVLVYSSFAFLMTLLREIVKDVEDLKGDKLTRCRTIPIVLGIKKTNVVLITLSVIGCLLLFLFASYLFKIQSYITSGIIFTLGILVPIQIILVVRSRNANYHNCSIALKFFILLGVLSMIFV